MGETITDCKGSPQELDCASAVMSMGFGWSKVRVYAEHTTSVSVFALLSPLVSKASRSLAH